MEAVTAVETRERRRKRANGEGTIGQVRAAGWISGADGPRHWRSALWRGRLVVDGQRQAVYASKRAEVLMKLDALRRRRDAGQLRVRPAGADTVGSYLDDWLETKRSVVRVRTYERYQQLVRKHLVPTLGATRLVALQPDALLRLYQERAATGLSARTVQHIHMVLHTALEQAMLWGYVPRNVARLVRPPSVQPREADWPTGADVARLLSAATNAGDRLQALWIVAAHTGCRLGELLGLGWDAVDLEAGMLHVRRVLVRVARSQPVFGPPKTRRSRRSVPLTDDAVAAFKAHRARQGSEGLAMDAHDAAADLVFTNQLGRPLSSTVLRTHFKRALARAGLPHAMRFHDLRHTAATLLLTNGVDVPTVSAMLGHARTSTTVDIYWHALPARVNTATAVLQRLLGSAD